ncbi:uncharacterized protein F4822DRAFT_195033 [Hypoxylon trugodes]|uniref:uncharacterized protein n=1 Tax=Hypoxylon trugodes TaxID=326681 RepID=UPI0021949D0F|nr:uncharacterized protein F4822DRAFT_195033 [Hypoxylon trugodes]KAI1389265.1 hypothetical protein F4822DRAFT_195033 [Hypoxylon trugodes]
MVFPSRGCITCKQRRIKCDSVHPTCGRCQKANRPCNWDGEETAGLLFRSENAFAQGRPRRPWKPKGREGAEVEIQPDDDPVVSVISPPTLMASPVAGEALRFWLKNYVFQRDEIPELAREYTYYLETYRGRDQPDSSLRLAVSAFSRAIFARATHPDTATDDAEGFFARSIAKMQDEFHGLSQENIDELLLTTMLLAHYENMRYQSQTQEQDESPLAYGVTGFRFWKDVCHHCGAAGLLKLRRERGWSPNLPLDRSVRRQLIRTYILRGEPVDEWLEDGAQYGEEGPVLGLDSVMVRLAHLRSNSLCLFLPKSGMFSSQLHPPDVVAQALELDVALETWSRDIPEGWEFSTKSATTPSATFDGFTHVYATHGHAAIWNRYRAVHVIVNSMRKRALIIMSRCSTQMISTVAEQEVCQEKITSLATDICRSIPVFASQDPNSSAAGTMSISNSISPKMATLLAWPLTLVISTEYVPEPQKQWLRNILKSIANSLGDAVLEAVTEKSEFKF